MEEKSIYDMEPPASESGGLFLNLKDGETAKMRFLGTGINWRKDFTNENGETNTSDRFASVVLYRNQETKANEIRVFEFGWQIQKQLRGFLNDEDWGSLEGYDVAITRTGKGLTTKYQCIAKPKKPLTDDERELIKESPVDLRKVCKVGVRDDDPGEYDPFPTD